MPSWLSEEDVNYYVTKFNQTGFTGGLNYYRALDLTWELTAPWTGLQIKVPVKFIVGDEDVTYTTPGIKEYIQSGGFKRAVPFLEELVVMEGVAHFLNQEKPEEISVHILDFIQRTWELTAPWTGLQIKVPVKFIVGDEDVTYTTPRIKEYIQSGGFKRAVPFLEELIVMEGVSHFLNQEKPEEISAHILDFIQRF